MDQDAQKEKSPLHTNLSLPVSKRKSIDGKTSQRPIKRNDSPREGPLEYEVAPRKEVYQLLSLGSVDDFNEYRKSNPNLRIVLHNAALRGIPLPRINLRGADLSGTNFVGANLEYADFTNAILKKVNFFKADLFRAKFRGADLEGAKGLYGKLIRY
jgi:Pentapeptide repeats (8 copies)